MEKIKNFILISLSLLLFFSTSNFATWTVSAEEDVTKVNRFYSADEVVSGTTIPNARVTYEGPNKRGEKQEVFSALANKEGVFKLFVESHRPDTTFKIHTYDSTGKYIESDEVFVLRASLNAAFSIYYVDDEPTYVQGPTKRILPVLRYNASPGSKIEIIIDNKVIKSFIVERAGILRPTEVELGDFVKMRVSKGDIVKTYESMATPLNTWDYLFLPYPIFTSRVTTWSDSISIYLPPNLKYSGLFNKTNSDYPAEPPTLFTTGETGIVKQFFNENTTLKDLKPLTLYEDEFENVVYNYFFTLKTSTKPEIDPVSQITKEITGFATASSIITVFDEQKNKLGESTADENGKFAVPVSNLTPDTVIKIETTMPNTDKSDYIYTSVEEVYIEELSDNNAYITGQSSFGTTAEVFLLEPASLSSNATKAIAGSTALATNSKKSIGTFTLSNNSTFKLNIGKQKANSIVQVVLKEGGKSLTLPSKTVKDKTAPVISGAANKSIPINSTFNAKTNVSAKDNVNGTLTSAIKVSGTVNTKKKGTYNLIYTVTDKSGNQTKITRKITVVDNVKPVISGAANKTIRLNSSFNPKTSVTAKDNIDGSLTSKIKVTGTVNTKKKGTYTLKYTVTDSSKNVTTVTRKITVDSTKPVISGAKSKTIKLRSSFSSKTGVTAKDNLDGNLTSKIKVTGTVNTKAKGSYTLTYTVTDKSNNKAVVKRKITVK
ncbi:immunoglobulin-like domain-containing protein [Planomicrobium sp. CPCC 101079]|uniref:immunoglobulin-like domain-containing protein n=1 Tax=Planomicrobium sp. CPCC 101079 TaxID=2599618 RepID=UPI0011B6B643|nr:immunoglobulin-like domain-containing protein [Planomicrobium sp. CPCC 101079]TWT01499.1 DUF5011 domain-containing protein [Planomicrobium sp. CPCC 101079]